MPANFAADQVRRRILPVPSPERIGCHTTLNLMSEGRIQQWTYALWFRLRRSLRAAKAGKRNHLFS